MLWRSLVGRYLEPMFGRVIGVVLSVLLLSAAPVFAGINQWTSKGPSGGLIRSLAIDPQAPATLYAGTEGSGVFKSIDGGDNWNQTNTGLTRTIIFALVVDPTTPTTLYAGTEGGVFKSTSGASSWINTALPNSNVAALAIDPSSPTTIYAGTDGQGIYKSTNGGNSWSQINNGLTNSSICTLTIDQASPTTIYAGTYGGGLFKSTDGGANWSQTNSGMTNSYVYSLAINPTTPTTLYAGTYGGGVFKSINGGASWTHLSTGLTNGIVHALAIDPAVPATLYAGTEGGVFQSFNNGDSWHQINSCMSTNLITVLVMDSATPSSLYLGTYGGGIFSGGGFNAVTNTISGTVTQNGNGLAGVTFSGAPCTTANSYGVYCCTVAPGWSGTITPILANAIFTPVSRSYSGVASDQGVQDYTVGNNSIAPPLVTTGAASAISATGATLSGTISRNGADATLTFEYGPNSNYSIGVFGGTVLDDDVALTVYAETTGLACGTTYHFRAIGANSAGTTYGLDQSFSTAPCPVNGACGSSDGKTFTNIPTTNFCSAGTASAVTGSSPWSWSCQGVNGGSTANCSALLAPFSPQQVSWHQTSGPEGGEIWALVVDPSSPQTMYAATWGGGIFKSTNGGFYWNAVNNGLADPYLNSLVLDKSNPQTLYAGADIAGVLKSIDGGASWSVASNGLTDKGIWSLAIDPANSQVMYAGTYASGVFKSTNGGDSWSPVNNGIENMSVFSLVIDPKDSQTIYAGTYSYDKAIGSGIYKSIDGGVSWNAVNAGLTGMDVTSLAIDPNNSQVIYAGVQGPGIFKSINGGISWAASSKGITGQWLGVRSLIVDKTNSLIVYAGIWNAGGMYKSIDGGDSWSAFSYKQGMNINALAFNPVSPNEVYAGTNSGVYSAYLFGGSWSEIDRGLVATSIGALAVDPSAPWTVYAGSDLGGLFKSTNRGVLWDPINYGLPDTTITSIAIDPTTPQTVYVGTYCGVFKSINGGGFWSAANSGLLYSYASSVVIDPVTPQTLYVSTFDGVYKSVNGGGFWSAVNNGLPGTTVRTLAIDPSNSQILYAGTYSGVFRSTNGGVSWSAIAVDLTNTNVSALLINSSNSQMLYAGTAGGGIFKSTNGGDSWNSVNNGLADLEILALVIDPTNPENIFASAWTTSKLDGGVYLSTDGGGTWTNTGLTRNRVWSLASDPSGFKTFYAGAWGLGVLKTYKPLKISGRVTENGVGLAGVTFLGADCTTTDNTGAYSCSVAPWWYGTIAPSLSGYTFFKQSLSFEGINTDQAAQNFTATFVIIPPDIQKPVVTDFTVPLISVSLNVTIPVLTATDNVGVTGYLLSESATVPSASASGWSIAQPSSYTFTSAGTKTLYAFARDAAGNVSHPKEATVTIDITPPQLVLSTMKDGAITNKNTLNIAGSVGDVSGMVSLLINNVAITVNPDGSFSHAITLVAGDNTLTTVATDAAGNTTSDIRTIRLDQAAPLLDITTPTDNSKTAQALATFSGTVDESATVVVKSSLNGSQNAALDGNSFTATVNLENGLNTIDVIVTDLAGNSTSVKRTVTYDPLKPSLAVTIPANDVTIHDGKITISGTPDGTISGIADLHVSADGKEYHPGFTDGSFTQELTFSDEKIYPVVVTVIDEAGNSDSVTRNVIFLKGTIVINGGSL